jgi:hypothetical protein
MEDDCIGIQVPQRIVVFGRKRRRRRRRRRTRTRRRKRRQFRVFLFHKH